MGPRAIPDITNPSKVFTSSGSGFVLSPVTGTTDFVASSFGGTVAFRATPQLQLGLTVSAARLKADSRGTRFRTAFGSGFPTDPNAISASTVITNETSIDDSSSGTSLTLGALYHAGDRLRIGVQYVKGPDFTVDENFQTNPGLASNVNQPLVTASGYPKAVSLHVPDRVGAGISYRANPRLLVGVDVVQVNYSRLAKDFVLIFNDTTVTPDMYTFDDAVELHAGAEYAVIPGARAVFIRAGVSADPDHRLKYLTQSTDPLTNSSQNAIYNLLPRDTNVRGTVGVGIAVGARAQVDAAYAVGREFVASMGVRF
jgi:long-subunit fatty acid transport protein